MHDLILPSTTHSNYNNLAHGEIDQRQYHEMQSDDNAVQIEISSTYLTRCRIRNLRTSQLQVGILWSCIRNDARRPSRSRTHAASIRSSIKWGGMSGSAKSPKKPFSAVATAFTGMSKALMSTWGSEKNEVHFTLWNLKRMCVNYSI